MWACAPPTFISPWERDIPYLHAVWDWVENICKFWAQMPGNAHFVAVAFFFALWTHCKSTAALSGIVPLPSHVNFNIVTEVTAHWPAPKRIGCLGICCIMLCCCGDRHGASIGQVWTRHLAPAVPAFTRPSLPPQFTACSTCHLILLVIVLLLTLPDLGVRDRGLLVLGIFGGSRLGYVPSSVVASDCVPC